MEFANLSRPRTELRWPRPKRPAGSCLRRMTQLIFRVPLPKPFFSRSCWSTLRSCSAPDGANGPETVAVPPDQMTRASERITTDEPRPLQGL